MTNTELIRSLQERAARALPAEYLEELDGWWLRHAPGCAWWVSSVLPHGAVPLEELVPRVAAVEAFYAQRDETVRFQLSPGVCPAELDTVLAQRGYRRSAAMSLQTGPIPQTTRIQEAGELRLRRDDHPTTAWFEAWEAVHGAGGDGRAEWGLLERVRQPSAYASAMVGGEVVAVGRAVADTGWVGVFGMATLPAARGAGAAGRVLGALADWAASQRAENMYLQVERENLAALRLYERLGFSELTAYHYRTAG